MRFQRKRINIAALILVLLVVVSFPPKAAQGAALTSISDTMSTLVASTAANHTIVFTTPTGVSNGETITVTFNAGFTMGSVAEDDTDISGSTFGELTTAADCLGTEQAGVAVSGQTITFTLCSGDGASFGASETVTIEIGTNATASGTGSNQITNPTAGNDYDIDIGGTQTDSGTLAVSIIADDSVNITSTVDPRMTFAISTTTIGFGTLDVANDRWATADTLGTTTPTSAHTMTIQTNATNGWAITYNGATLTSGTDTISVATITGDPDGTPGTEQFAIGASTDGDATVASGYEQASNNFKFVADTTTTLISETVPTATETISVYYLANIASNTEAGTYSTDITYIATGTF